MNTFKAALAAAIAVAPFTVSLAYAQNATALPEVVAQGDTVAAPVRMGTGVNAGTTQINQQDISIRSPGSGDVNELLRIMPTVDFSRNDTVASRDHIQDLRPANITISGGLFYENLITLDGIGASSRLDVTNTSPQNGAELAGGSAQMLWLDADMIGSMTLRDSNVSAEFGNFSGGVLEIKTRDPRRTFSVGGNLSYNGDGLTQMVMSKKAKEAIGDGDLPQTPKYDKWRYGATIDAPLGDNAAIMVAYTRKEASVVHYASENYGNTPRKMSSIDENFLVRGVYDIDNATKLTGQFSYSPYTSESSTDAAIDSTVVSKSGGYAGKLELDHNGPLNWNIEATYSTTDTGRTAPDGSYNLPSNTDNGAFCLSNTCTMGGIGNLDQTEEVYGLKARIAGDVGLIKLRGGVAYEHVSANKERPADGYSYSRGAVSTAISCADGNSLTCVTGQYALTQMNFSPAYHAKAAIDSVGAWAEAEIELGRFTVRPGLRYDYESFLGNHVLAPRFALSYELPWDNWEVSLGANRYYGMSTLSYALRSQYPASSIYKRNPTVIGGKQVYSDAGWFLSSVSNSNGYANGGLDTPYSDELTAAISGKVFGGDLRVKGILRNGENNFVRSPMQSVVEDNGDGTTITRRFFEMTNDGWKRYRSVSLEWMRSFGQHGIGFSVNYAKTKTRHTTYFDDVDDTLFEDVPVLFNGEVTTSTQIADTNRRSDYGSPLKIAASWTGQWLDNRVRTNLTGRFQTGFKRIEDTGINQTIGGIRYDVYDWEKYSSTVDFDLNVQADVVQSKLGTLTLDLRVSNLLNTVPASTYVNLTEYQYGRSAWLGIKFRY